MTEFQYIKEKINLSERSIANTLELLAEGATIPFIARYRKDKTQNLDELAIESIQKYAHHYAEIQKRKESILNSIQEQEKLTPELKKTQNKSRHRPRERIRAVSQNHYGTKCQ